jgi:hypothetical protein
MGKEQFGTTNTDLVRSKKKKNKGTILNALLAYFCKVGAHMHDANFLLFANAWTI